MKPNRAVSNWLFLLSFMVFGMVAGGGHARTIGASFILESWHPVTGFLPPMDAAAWAHEFQLFRQTAVYHAHPVTLAQYKRLFWPMFLDRDWGRLMALVFLLPLAWFLRTGQVSARLAAWLLAIFAAGGAQAVFGWFMVRAGLQPGVLTPPPAYAAPHFISAMLIFAALLWTALTLRNPAPAVASPRLRGWANASVVLVFCTMSFGALVVATNALTVFNTFPLMDGRLVPAGMFREAQPTVQFVHRALATGSVLVVLVTAGLGLRDETVGQNVRDLCLAMGGLVALQFLLGIVTVVLGSPGLGYLHELNAVLLLATVIATRQALGSSRFSVEKLRKRLLPPLVSTPGA